jgi:hypothetical protein
MIKLGVKRIGTSGAMQTEKIQTLDTNYTIKINMKRGLLTLFLSFFLFTYSQDRDLLESSFSPERFPVFPRCENLENKELESCFL